MDRQANNKRILINYYFTQNPKAQELFPFCDSLKLQLSSHIGLKNNRIIFVIKGNTFFISEYKTIVSSPMSSSSDINRLEDNTPVPAYTDLSGSQD